MKKLFIITTILLFVCLFILAILPKEEVKKEKSDSISTENYEYQNIDTDITIYNNLSNLYYINNNHLQSFIKEHNTFSLVVISNNKESKELTNKLNNLLDNSEFYTYIIDQKELSSIKKTPTIIFYIDGEEVLKTTKVDNIKKLYKEFGYLK